MPSKYFCLAISLISPAVLCAGPIYGSVIAGGRGVARANIEINCNGAITRGATADDGSYRINVPQQGQCALSLPDYAGRPSAVIFSNPNPAPFSFELVQRPDRSYELRRR
jgi:hypothetical protein